MAEGTSTTLIRQVGYCHLKVCASVPCYLRLEYCLQDRQRGATRMPDRLQAFVATMTPRAWRL
ncbi:hypothetical protein SAMN05216360_12327 [Methylobacterium phyllostachyos]|uniref:Uncharacterized protein n=1 Tax=Methylobacterium phyllostachyos TaxID=582672 RepID=A0A1H0JMX5_9HYPH|nr:hypothetical protein SAMN05216360_12327 [Methylobacterium phyllostachyos]